GESPRPRRTSLGELDVAECLRGRQIPGGSGVLCPPSHALGEAAPSTHLTAMGPQRGDLAVERRADVEPDVWIPRAEQEHARYAVLLEAVPQLFGEEQMVARGDDAVERARPGNAMVGMDLVMAPGIVREHHVGLVLPDDPASFATELHRSLELAVLMPEEHEFLDPDGLAGGALFGLARLRHLRGT